MRRKIITIVGLIGLTSALGVAVRADWNLNPFRKEDGPPQDPFASRAALTPPPATNAAPAAATTSTPPQPTYVAQRTAPTPYSQPTNYAQPAAYNPPASTPASAPAYGVAPANAGVANEAAQPYAPPVTAAVPAIPPAAELPRIAQAVARVGDETIFDIEITAPVQAQLNQRMRQNMSPSEAEALRRELTKDALDALIEQKLVVYKAKKEIPSDVFPRIEKSIYEQFEKSHMKELMTRAKVQTRADLERVLQQSGSSIERQKKAYLERTITYQWIRKEVNYDPEISHQEMIDFYHGHREEYAIKGRANWEEIVVRFDKFRNKDEAYNAIAEMGNDVLRGQPLADVAKQRSHGITASQGGARGWTNQGALASQAIDQALFSLPVGSLSRIIEDPRGLYIVRVIERQNATHKPFFDVQADVRDKIKKEKVSKETKEYLAKLRAKTPIWTIFDDPQTAARPVTNEPLR